MDLPSNISTTQKVEPTWYSCTFGKGRVMSIVVYVISTLLALDSKLRRENCLSYKYNLGRDIFIFSTGRLQIELDITRVKLKIDSDSCPWNKEKIKCKVHHI